MLYYIGVYVFDFECGECFDYCGILFLIVVIVEVDVVGRVCECICVGGVGDYVDCGG